MLARTKANQKIIKVLSACIRELEAKTDAEVVLVIRRKSGTYRDVDFLCGAIFSFIVLIFTLFSPLEFAPHYVPIYILLSFTLAASLSHFAGRYGPRRFLTGSKRQKNQVHRGATSAYFDKKIFQTPNRTGVLLYFSALERTGELLADAKARQALGERLEEFQSLFQNACASGGTVRGAVLKIAEFLRTFGVYLGQTLPLTSGVTADTRPNILDNTADIHGEDE